MLMRSKIAISKNGIQTILLLVVYFLFLELIAHKYIYTVWQYAGFIGKLDYNRLTLAVGFITYFGYFVPGKISLYRIVYLFLLVFSFIPMLSIWSMEGFSTPYLYSILLSMLVFQIGINVNMMPARVLKISLPPYAGRISIFVVLMVFGYFLATRGFQSMIFSFDDVYANRHSASEGVSIGIISYLVIWTGKVMIPLLTGMSLVSKNKLYIAYTIILAMLLFAFTTLKSNLFYPVIVILLWFIYKTPKWSQVFTTLLILFLGISFFMWYFMEDQYLLAVFVRRVLFFPAKLNLAYYEYFSDHGFVYMSNNLTSLFIEYPLWGKHVDVIGDYIGFSDMAANTGLFGVGYMHFGLLGPVIFSFLTVLLVQWMNYIIKNGGIGFVGIAATINPLREVIVSSDFLTALLSHGVIFSLLMIMMLKGKKFIPSSKRPLKLRT